MKFKDTDIKKGLIEFKKPIWVALGNHDYVTEPAELWNNIRQEFKDIQVNAFEKSAHYPCNEETVAFDEKILNWIKEKVIVTVGHRP